MVVKAYPWDYYLEEAARPRVEGFRRSEWRNIQTDLRKVGVTLGVEPCWVEPGRAVFWQEQKVREREVVMEEGGARTVFVERSTGYTPTLPQPANNASLIARYLRKGLLLRPPGQETVEIKDEVPLIEPDQPEPYICFRHGADIRKSFPTWKGYMNHCRYYVEKPEYGPPQGVSQRADKYAYYCLYHNVGFDSESGAKRHITVESRRTIKSSHIPLESMKVTSEKEHR